jgi:hypothetical protein
MKTKQSEADAKPLKKEIKLSISEILMYSGFLLTFGASIYTFFNAIPEMKNLGTKIDTLNVQAAVSQTKIADLDHEIDRFIKQELQFLILELYVPVKISRPFLSQ